MIRAALVGRRSSCSAFGRMEGKEGSLLLTVNMALQVPLRGVSLTPMRKLSCIISSRAVRISPDGTFPFNGSPPRTQSWSPVSPSQAYSVPPVIHYRLVESTRRWLLCSCGQAVFYYMARRSRPASSNRYSLRLNLHAQPDCMGHCGVTSAGGCRAQTNDPWPQSKICTAESFRTWCQFPSQKSQM